MDGLDNLDVHTCELWVPTHADRPLNRRIDLEQLEQPRPRGKKPEVVRTSGSPQQHSRGAISSARWLESALPQFHAKEKLLDEIL